MLVAVWRKNLSIIQSSQSFEFQGKFFGPPSILVMNLYWATNLTFPGYPFIIEHKLARDLVNPYGNENDP